MAIPVTSTHTATLSVPVSGDPASAVIASMSGDGRTMVFTAQGGSPAAARQLIRDFLDAARAAAQD